MSTKVSPPYPGHSVATVCQWVRNIRHLGFDKSFTFDDAAKELGYKNKRSGIFRGKISDMRQFAMIQTEGETCHLLDLGLTLCDSSPERFEYQEALYTAGMSPPIFREIHETMPNAPKDTIELFLLRDKGFAETGARRCAEAFLESAEDIGLYGKPLVQQVAPSPANETSVKETVIPIMFSSNRSGTVTLPNPMASADWKRLIKILEAHAL